MSLTVGTGDINLVQALELLHGDLWDEQRAMANFGIGLDATELTGTEDVARVGKRGGDADRTGLRVHLAIDEGDVPLQRKDLSVCKCESKWKHRGILQ